MGWRFFKYKKGLQIEIIVEILLGEEFDYLRPKGKLVCKIDSVYDVPKIDIIFDDWYINSVCLWSKDKKTKATIFNV